MSLTVVDQGLLSSTAQYTGFKNRIINGAMVIDQRNAGASVAISGAPYSLDRWQTQCQQSGKLTVQQDSSAPTGFTKSIKFTVTATATLASTDSFRLIQKIEGINTADLNWGAAAASAGQTASPVTVSFWVKSSVTGTFGSAIQNDANNRSYPYSYAINSANTWEYKTITVPADTAGTWNNDTTGVGLYMSWGLGCGTAVSSTAGSWQAGDFKSVTGATNLTATNGATWQVTGVQLEKGSTATSFDYRPYGTELSLCQRYYYKWLNDTGAGKYVANLQAYATTAVYGKLFDFPVTMRATPSCSSSGSLSVFKADSGLAGVATGITLTEVTKSSMGSGGAFGVANLVAGNCSVISMANNGYFDASAEL